MLLSNGMHSPSHCIELQDVTVSLNDISILERVSFVVEKGQYVGVLGPNGSGKTTLLKVIVGLLAPTSGEAMVLGRPAGDRKNRWKIGYVPQSIAHTAIDFPATVEEVVSSGRTARVGLLRPFSDTDRRMVEEAMEQTDIRGYCHRRLRKLSGGERQRVFIARALAAEPELLILDEPTGGVDVRSQESFYKLLRWLNRTKGLTILFVSHDLDVITREASTMLCLNRTLVCHASPEELMKGDILRELYGKDTRLIHHHHDEKE